MQGLAGGRYQAVQDHLYAAGRVREPAPQRNASDFGSRCGSDADYARMQIRLVDDFRKAGHRIRRQISGGLTARRGMARQQSDRINDHLSYGIRPPLLAARRSDAPDRRRQEALPR